MENITLYEGVSCSSSRKAKQYLADKNIAHEVVKLPKMEVTREFIRTLLRLSENGTEDILKGNHQEKYENASLRALENDIIDNPNILKTPIVIRITEHSEQMLVGYNEDEFRTLINRSEKIKDFQEIKRLISVAI